MKYSMMGNENQCWDLLEMSFFTEFKSNRPPQNTQQIAK